MKADALADAAREQRIRFRLRLPQQRRVRQPSIAPRDTAAQQLCRKRLQRRARAVRSEAVCAANRAVSGAHHANPALRLRARQRAAGGELEDNIAYDAIFDAVRARCRDGNPGQRGRRACRTRLARKLRERSSDEDEMNRSAAIIVAVAAHALADHVVLAQHTEEARPNVGSFRLEKLAQRRRDRSVRRR